MSGNGELVATVMEFCDVWGLSDEVSSFAFLIRALDVSEPVVAAAVAAVILLAFKNVRRSMAIAIPIR